MADIKEVESAWASYISSIEDWEKLVEGIEPKVGGCGLVYEVPNPIDRPGEGFAIADMRELGISEPHKHINGEVEIYFVLQGVGKIAVGSEVRPLNPGDMVTTPSGIFHITAPNKDLVLAVVNTPPFNIDNYVVMDENEPLVSDAMQKLMT